MKKLTKKTNKMETQIQKSAKTNKITFFRNGKQVYDFKINGNIVTFSNGDIILL